MGEENMVLIGFYHYTTIPKMVHKDQDQIDVINLCFSSSSSQFLFLPFWRALHLFDTRSTSHLISFNCS